MAFGALHHQTPAQVGPSPSGVVEVGERVRHRRDPLPGHHLPNARSFILAGQPIGQPVQRGVQGAGHVGVRRLRAPKWGGRVRGKFADKRGKEVGVAGLGRLDQTVDVDVELLLLEGAGENTVGQVLHPGQQREVQVFAAVTTQHVNTQEHLPFSDLLTGRLALRTK